MNNANNTLFLILLLSLDEIHGSTKSHRFFHFLVSKTYSQRDMTHMNFIQKLRSLLKSNIAILHLQMRRVQLDCNSSMISISLLHTTPSI